MATTVTDPHELAFRTFLDAHLDQELLRFTTAGSVDDGKSTLIGRLLHDTRSVYEDQLAAVRASRVNRAGEGRIDLSLLTDGLRAEREQGITIDVAYRYFSTSKRKFIIADTPGHEQYTRNMATGASTADVAIVLIDAAAFVKAGGLLPQSRRHTNIASLLRIPHVVAAVNKMDLVGYAAEVFERIAAEFTKLAAELGLESIELVPVSALAGDNVVDRTANMPWYAGPTLLEYLETVPLRRDAANEPLRFPVQLVVRPDATFRGFAGRIERGEIRPGLRVRALPSGRVTTVKSILTWDGELKRAASPRAVTVELEDEIDLSRGEMLVAEGEFAPLVSTRLRAMLVWMHEQSLAVGLAVPAEAHDADGACHRASDPPSHRCEHGRTAGGCAAWAQRHCRGGTRNKSSAVLRSLRGEPGDGIVHPDRPGDECDGRGRDDRCRGGRSADGAAGNAELRIRSAWR